MIRHAVAGAAATAPVPVVWTILGYPFEAGPLVVSILVVLITRLCVFLNTHGRRQVYLDVAVTVLCSVIAAVWTQAHALSLLPAAVSSMTIAGIGYGLIGIGKSRMVAALQEAVRTFGRGIAADAPAAPASTDAAEIERLTDELNKID